MNDYFEFAHLVKLATQQQTGVDHSQLMGVIIKVVDPAIPMVQVALDILRNETTPPIVSPPMPLCSIAANNGIGIQYVPCGGERVVVNMIESTTGFAFSASMYWTPAMSTPAGALSKEQFPDSIDQNIIIPKPALTPGPGDIIERNLAGAMIVLGTDETLIKHQSGSHIRFLKNGDMSIVCVGNLSIQSNNRMSLTATENIDASAGADINASAGSNISAYAAEQVAITAGAGAYLTAHDDVTIASTTANILESAAQNIQILAKQDIWAQAAQDLMLYAAVNLTITSPLTQTMGAVLETHNAAQFFGFYKETTDISLSASHAIQAVGKTAVIISGSDICLGNQNGTAAIRNVPNAQNLTIAAAANVLIGSTGQVQITGKSEVDIYGEAICIGVNRQGQYTVAPQEVLISGSVVDLEGNYPGVGYLRLGAINGHVDILADNIWALANRSLYAYADNESYFGSGGFTYLLGTHIEQGYDPTFPSAPSANPTNGSPVWGTAETISAPACDEIDLFATDLIELTGTFGNACSVIQLEGGACYSNDAAGNSTDLQVLTINGQSVFNNHTHHESGGGDTDPPSQQMDETCVSKQFYVQPQSGGGA